MIRVVSRIAGIVLLMIAAVVSMAANLVVTSPTEGSYLGSSNTLQFNITGAVVQVTVKATVTGPTGSVTTFSQQFTPDTDGKITGSMPLNFSESSTQGAYTIDVSATEPNNTYSDVTVHAIVDAIAPKFLEFNPVSGRYVRDVVKIRASILEPNLKEWRVQVNGQDIPNNTGTTNTVSVDWDTTTVQHDGSQSITILAKDLANNQTTQTISVTLDRIAPILTISYPSSNSHPVPGTDLTVLVDVADASSSSVDWTGMDVIAKRLDGTFITRVSRISFKSSGSNSNRWTGRIKYRAGQLPTTFKIVATVTDKAGNTAAPQEVTVTIGRKH